MSKRALPARRIADTRDNGQEIDMQDMVLPPGIVSDEYVSGCADEADIAIHRWSR
jgi:hypothetical protein